MPKCELLLCRLLSIVVVRVVNRMVFVNFFLVPACIYAMAGAYFYTWSIGIKQATVARKKMAIHIYARVQSKQMVHKSRQKKCN